MNQLPLIAQRMFNTPLAIHPAKAEVIVAALADRLGVSNIMRPNAGWYGDDDFRSAKDNGGYDITDDGVAVIGVSGTLVQQLGSLRPYSGMTGYDGIRQNFLSAMLDPSVKAILLDISSPGGEVSGLFDLADEIYAQRGEKPIWAILNDSAYSAAYALASAADVITVPRTGGTGSIGVIWMHVDWSKALAQGGLNVSILTFGERKADGHPEIPLSDEARARFQADIDTMGELFADTVARNRGMAASSVVATQATTFLGASGVSAGLADFVMSPDEAYRKLINQL